MDQQQRHPALNNMIVTHTASPCQWPHLCLLLLRPVEDVLRAEHAEDREDLIAAAKVNAGDQHLAHGRLKRELRHLAAQTCQQALLQAGDGDQAVVGSAMPITNRPVPVAQGHAVVGSVSTTRGCKTAVAAACALPLLRPCHSAQNTHKQPPLKMLLMKYRCRVA